MVMGSPTCENTSSCQMSKMPNAMINRARVQAATNTHPSIPNTFQGGGGTMGGAGGPQEAAQS